MQGRLRARRTGARWLLLAALAGGFALGGGCRDDSSPRPMSISIAPAHTRLPLGRFLALQLRIPDDVTSGTVYWKIEGAGIGNATVGWLRETGDPLSVAYEPPAAVPSPDTVVVRSKLESPGRATAFATATIQLVPPVSVVVTPPSARVHVGEQVRFSAEVVGGTGEQQVAWAVVNTAAWEPGLLGSIDATGLYTAPAMAPGLPVIIQATSVPFPMASGTASADVRITLTVEPATEVTLPFGGTQQFTAILRGANLDHLYWWLQPAGGFGASVGTIGSDGLYTAPVDARNDDVLRVVAQADAEAAVTVVIHLIPPDVAVTGLSGPATAGDTLSVHGSGFVGEPALELPLADGSTLTLVPRIVSEVELQVAVPAGATSGPVSVVMHHGELPATRGGPVAFTRLPRLRLHPVRRDLAPGEATEIAVAFLGAGPVPLAWVTDVGTVAEGTYRAPGAVAADGFARVTACVAGTAICDATVLGLHPFRIEPAAGLLTPGASLALSAIGSAGPIAATWRVVAGGGAIAPDGTYTASTAIAEAGLAVIAATRDGVEERAPIGIRGVFPGLVARASDHVDRRTTPFAGARALGVAAAGAGAYAVASRVADLPDAYAWLDAYDVTTVTAPRWLGAAEAYGEAWQPWIAGGHLLLQGADARGRACASLYALASGVPQLVAVDGIAAWDRLAVDGDLLYALDPAPSGTAGPAPRSLRVHDLRTGSLAPARTVHLAFPGAVQARALAVDGDRVYVGTCCDPGPRLLVFAVSGDEGAFVGSVEDDSAWVDLRVAGGFLFSGARVYDPSGRLPTYLSSLPVGSLVAGGPAVAGAHGTRLLVATYQDGMRLVDVADPARPRLVGTFLTAAATGILPTWAGDHVLQAEREGGLAVYDVSAPGGPVEGTPFAVPDAPGSSVAAAALAGDALYLSVADPAAPAVRVLALDHDPPAEVGRIEGIAPRALAAGGGFLYAATGAAVEVWDVAAPSAAARVAIVAEPAWLLARSGDLLFLNASGPPALQELVAVDVRVPAAPAPLGRVATGTFARALAAAGTTALLAAGWDGLLVFDASGAATPALVAHLDLAALGGEVNDVAVAGTLAYVATGAGLVIVDIADPARPVVRARACPPDLDVFEGFGPACHATISRVTVTGDLLWTFGWWAVGWDVRNPDAPRVASLSSLNVQGCTAVGVRGSRLYATSTGTCAITGTRPIDLSAARNVVHLLYPADGLWRP